MKVVAHLNNTKRYQYVKLSRLALTSTLLSLSLVLTACSNEGDTATKKDPKNKPGQKPADPTNKHLAYDALGALLNIGLFSIERATEIAIKENEATSLLTQGDCQKAVATTVGTNKNVQVTTLKGGCIKAKQGLKWSGAETLKASINDGVLKSLSSSLSDFFQIETVQPKHLYTIKPRLSLTPSTATAANTVFDLNGLVDIGVQIQDGNKIRNAQFDIQIIGLVQISQSTGKMTAIAIDSAQIFMNREDKLANHTTTSTVTLTPDQTGLIPLTCGRFVGRMNVDQKVSSTSNRSEIVYKSALLFSEKTVSDIKDKAMTTKVAACSPGFESIESDLREAGNKAINTLKALKPEVLTREGGEQATDESDEEAASE
jgi:hypothetical protein